MPTISRIRSSLLPLLILFSTASQSAITNQDPATTTVLIRSSVERLITDLDFIPTRIAIAPSDVTHLDEGVTEAVADDLSATVRRLDDLSRCDDLGVCDLAGLSAHFRIDGVAFDGNTATVTITVRTPTPTGVMARGLPMERYEVTAERSSEGWRVVATKVVAAT